MIKTKQIKENLQYYFTEVEKKDIAQRLARSVQDLEELEKKKKSIMAELKSQIEEVQSLVQKHSRHLNNGYDYRDIQCTVYFNEPRNGRKRIVRDDTGEQVAEQDMLPSERQLEITDMADIQQADAPEGITRNLEQKKEDYKEAMAEVETPFEMSSSVTQPEETEAKPIKEVVEEIVQEAAESLPVQEQPEPKEPVKAKRAGKAKADNNPDAAFIIRPGDWFLARIGKMVDCKNSDKNQFSGEMKIDDQEHAEYLASVAQNQQGFTFHDIHPGK